MVLVATIEIPASASVLTDYPVLIEPNSHPAWDFFWNTVREGGGDIRIRAGGNWTPRDVVSCARGARIAEIHAKVPSTSVSAKTAIEIHADGVSTEPAVTDPVHGRNAVWSGYHAVYHFEELATSSTVEDATGNGHTMTKGGSTHSDYQGPFGSGVGAHAYGGSSNYYSAEESETFPGLAYPHSLSVWVNASRPLSDSVSMAAMMVGDGGQSDRMTYIGSDDDYLARQVGSWQGFSALTSDDTSHPHGNWYHQAGVFKTASSALVYVDGVAGTENTDTVTDYLSDYDTIAVGELRDSSASSNWDGRVDEARWYDGELSADWISYEYNNQASPSTWYTVDGTYPVEITPPNTLAYPIGGSVTVEAVAGGGVSVTAPAGTLAFTGYAPSITAGSNVEVNTPAGTLAFSAALPSIETGVSVSAPSGTLTLTAALPSIETGVSVSAPAGSLTFSAQLPSIETGASVTAPSGTLALTGYIPTIDTGGINVPPGILTLSAQLPSIETGVSISAPTGTLTLSAQLPVVQTGATVTAPAGTLAFTGYAPSVAVSTSVSPPAGTLTFTAALPQIVVPVQIEVPSGILAFTGANVAPFGLLVTTVGFGPTSQLFSPDLVAANLLGGVTISAPADADAYAEGYEDTAYAYEDPTAS